MSWGCGVPCDGGVRPWAGGRPVAHAAIVGGPVVAALLVCARSPLEVPSLRVTDLIFFYGTLMRGFERHGRARLDDRLTLVGRGSIAAALFDLGLYPAAIPATDSRVWGEVHEMREPEQVLPALDELEGHRAEDPVTSLYVREVVPVTLDDGRVVRAWVYLYNAPIGRAARIESGDYLEFLKVRRPD